MTLATRFIFLLALSFFVFAIQAARVFAVFDVQPNLILIFFLILLFVLSSSAENLLFLGALLSVSFVLDWIFFSFWLLQLLILGVLLGLSFAYKSILTGTHGTDFLIILVLISGVFYGVLALTNSSEVLWHVVLAEIFYSLIIGLPLFFAIKNAHAKKEF